MSPGTVLSVRGLAKRFGRRDVLAGVDLDVPRGEIVGLLGPNGAGKTTLMSIVVGLVTADRGVVTLLGSPRGAADPAIRARIGFLQEKPCVYPEMSARDYLRFFAALYEIADPRRRVDAVLDQVGLSGEADRPLGAYSRGMQQRACLARAILHRPELLVLDEPTLGLDPVGVSEMRSLFLDLRAEGVTLIFSSHQLAEMERVCGSVVLIDGGRIVAAGTMDALSPCPDDGAVVEADLYEAAEPFEVALEALPMVARARANGPRLVITLRPGVDAADRAIQAALARRLSEAGATPLSVRPVRWGLEDLFLALTGVGGRGDPPGGSGRDQRERPVRMAG